MVSISVHSDGRVESPSSPQKCLLYSVSRTRITYYVACYAGYTKFVSCFIILLTTSSYNLFRNALAHLNWFIGVIQPWKKWQARRPFLAAAIEDVRRHWKLERLAFPFRERRSHQQLERSPEASMVRVTGRAQKALYRLPALASATT